MALEVGSTIVHYDVTALIGEGGMGQVYQATDTKLNRQVARPRREGRTQYRSVVLSVCLSVLSLGCADPGADELVLTAGLPLHLGDHLGKAKIDGSAVPDNLPEPIEWRFDEPQSAWKAGVPWNPTMEPLLLTRTEDALRLTLTKGTRHATGTTVGALELDLSGLRREDWGSLVLRARSSAERAGFYVAFNRRPGVGTASDFSNPYRHFADAAQLVPDGAIQTYQIALDIVGSAWERPWGQLALWFFTSEPTSIDVLSVSLIPAEAACASAPAGIRIVSQNGRYRRILYTHAPGRITYAVHVPEGGRLDVGLRGVRDGVPVTFRVTATPESGEPQSLHEETLADAEHWTERRVDLSHLAGRTVSLALEADADRAGSVALWGTPTVSGTRSSDHPNIIFYVIDGGGADLMSLYGYNRRTTPNLERLAAEGTVFNHAYSNSGWTRPSTASFMTSLQHSVLGGASGGTDPIPEGVVTMAEHLRGARYQTAVFTTNPNAASAHGRRDPLLQYCVITGGRGRRRDRRDPLGLQPQELRGRHHIDDRHLAAAWRGLLVGRDGPARVLGDGERLPDLRAGEDRSAVRRLRGAWPSGPHRRTPSRGPDRSRLSQRHALLGAIAADRGCSDRRAQVGLPHRAPGGR